MRFKGLDLNLLVALDVLLETRKVSLAAQRLNLSQPAMSSALNRLRQYLGDDLLVLDGKRMYPTAYALGLVAPLRECLKTIEAMVSSPTTFDPATSQRMFSIVASDYITQTVIAPLIARLATAAPGLRFDLLTPSDESARQMEDGETDVFITPEGFHDPTLPSELLFEERFVIAGWDRNPIFASAFDEADVFAHGHVAVSIGPRRTTSFADRQLVSLGKQRRIEATAASFSAVPWLLRDTLRLTFMHERLAHAMASSFPIAFAPIPFAFPAMRQIIQHHPAREDDEGLSWLRKQLHAASSTFAGGGQRLSFIGFMDKHKINPLSD